jgi:hypothetical protein
MMLQETLSNMSNAIENELEYLHHESSKLHRFFVSGRQSRNEHLDLSFYLEVNKTIESFLRNITAMIAELEDVKVGSNASKIQSLHETLNITQYSIVNMSLSKSHDELVSY